MAAPRAWFVHHRGSSRIHGPLPNRPSLTHDPMADLQAVLDATARRPAAVAPVPFAGGWIGTFSYDLGRMIEPAARHEPSACDDRPWPLVELAWCPSALVYDHLERRWYGVGPEHDSLPSATDHAESPPLRTGAVTSSLPRDAYLDAVRRIRAYIAAGDVFQTNLTQRLSLPFTGSTRHLARAALTASRARYGAYLELCDGRAIVSMSPELFLDVDPVTREIITRPIKGTRPAGATARELLESEKDAAELHMIVDLMRNDLGRICAFGSVSVPAGRMIETHPTVHHGVGEVRGRLRDDVSFTDVLRATFPPGSVTGAPKIRAMQIIDELEPVRRGAYCGAIGFVGDDGGIGLNVAIRTMQCCGVRPPHRMDVLTGTLDYGAGGGIVTDSDPAAEHQESLDKAAVLRLTLSGLSTA